MNIEDRNVIIQNLKKYQFIEKAISEDFLLSKLEKIRKTPSCEELHILSMLFCNMDIFLRPLDESIAIIYDKCSDPNKLKKKVHNLFGSINQGLHTLSEIGLARYFAEKGYQIDFDFKYNSTNDIDILASKNDERIFIEVLNFQSNVQDDILITGSLETLDKKYYEKIIKKIKTKKFSSSKFDGKLFIALDWIKDEKIAINTIHNINNYGDTEFKELAVKILEGKEYIQGIIFYNYFPNKGVENVWMYQK